MYTDHEKRTERRNVNRRLYGNSAALKSCCGEVNELEDGTLVWPTDCNAKLTSIFLARLRIEYEFTDWGELSELCLAYLERCETPALLEKEVQRSNAIGSDQQLKRDLDAQSAEWQAQDKARADAQAAALKNAR